MSLHNFGLTSCCLIIGIRILQAGLGSLGLWGCVLQCFLRITNEFCVLSCLRFHLRFTANNNERCQRATFQFLAK